MSIRTNVTAGSWQQIGTGPAIVQLISPGSNQAEVMVACETSQPATNADGLVLSSECSLLKFNLAQAIWARVVQSGMTALVAVQPDVAA